VKNLEVRGAPATVHRMASGAVYNIPATVHLEYFTSELEADRVYATHQYHFSPAQARALAAELLAAADASEAAPADTAGHADRAAPAGSPGAHDVQRNEDTTGQEQRGETPEKRGVSTPEGEARRDP
jgi:hypothetical protein